MKSLSYALVTIAILLATPSSAQERIDYGPFYYLTDEPDGLHFEGVVDQLTPLALLAALAAHDSIESIYLNSPGGEGPWAMAVGDIIRSSLLDTVVPAGATCQSACSILFFAGIGRALAGTLGVHRETVSGSRYISETVRARDEQLLCLGAAPEVLAAAAVTPSLSMHFFSAGDIERLGFTRGHTEGLAAMEAIAAPAGEIGFPDWRQFRAIGASLPASLETVDATDNVLHSNSGTVTWGLISGSSSTAVGAQFSFDEMAVTLRVALTPLNYAALPYFNMAVTVEITSSPDGPVFPQVARLSFVDPLEASGAISFQVALSSGRQYVAAVPTVLSNVALLAAQNADELFLHFEGYPESVVIRFPKGGPGNEVFATWLPIMQQHVAATSGRYCTRFEVG